jgi:integrase
MRGNITRRGKSSWRIKFDGEPDPVTGKRRTRYMTVTGKRADAEAELARWLNDRHKGILVDVTELPIAAWLWRWLDGKHGLSLRTVELYREIIGRRIVPTLVELELQKIKPVHVKDWLSRLTRSGSRKGAELSARTVRQAYRILHAALRTRSSLSS